jgi:hypothetical protein
MIDVQGPDRSLTFFSYLVNSFLNLLCHHEFVPYHITIHRLLFARGYVFLHKIPFFCYPSLFLLYVIWRIYPRLIICCSMDLEVYAISRQRCWRCFFILLLFVVVIIVVDTNTVGRLIIILLMIMLPLLYTFICGCYNNRKWDTISIH